MSSLRLAARQVAYANRGFWRNPEAAFFTFVFPLMFLAISRLFGDGTVEVTGGREVAISQFYVPAVAAFSVVSACYTSVAMTLVFARDEGILKRKRGTPLPAWAYIAGRVVHASFIALLLVAIVTVVGSLFYDVDVPTKTMPAFLITLVIGAASFCALGIAATSLVPNASAAPAIINATILPLLFISDVFIPLDDAPRWLGTIANFFPIRHYSEALVTTFYPFENGLGFSGGDLLVVAVWGIGGALVAARFFTWEPRR